MISVRVFVFNDLDGDLMYGVQALGFKDPQAYSPSSTLLANWLGNAWADQHKGNSDDCRFLFEAPTEPLVISGVEIRCMPLFPREQAPFRKTFYAAAALRGKTLGLHNALRATGKRF